MQIKLNVNLEPLKRAWNENPLACIAAAGLAATGAAKLLDARSAAKGRRAYAKQVEHSIKRSQR